MSDTENNRLAVIAALAQKSDQLGRTAAVKFCYFLQVLRGVPLGYHFTLYSYGPFDSDVLADLDSCEALGGVRSSLVGYPTGYGYEIRPGENVENVKALSPQFIQDHEEDLNWVVREFGNMTAALLELVSTIVYADREAAENGERLTAAELAHRVHDIKPRFAEQAIIVRILEFQNRGLLQSVDAN